MAISVCRGAEDRARASNCQAGQKGLAAWMGEGGSPEGVHRKLHHWL